MPTWQDVVRIARGMARLRTDPVDPVQLAELIEDAWRTQGPKRLVEEHDSAQS